MKKLTLIILFHLAFVFNTYGQVSTFDFPHNYSIKGKSGHKERFTPEMFDDSEKQKLVLCGLTDSLKTVVRRLTSSYDNLQYLIIDNVFYENNQLQNEINIHSIFSSGEGKSTSWNLVEKKRLSNGNLLVVASIQHVKTITYIYRFLIFDKTGKNLISRNDYCFLEKPKILQEINGAFSVIIEKDYSPILIQDFKNEWTKLEFYANVYRNSIPAICILRFSKEGNFIAKNSYLVHNDPKVQPDEIFDVNQDFKYNYVLVNSYLSGVVNQPTLAVVIVDRSRPSIFLVQNLHEENAIWDNDKSFFKKESGRVYAYLPRPDQMIEIKTPQMKTFSIPKNETAKKTIDQLMYEREKGDQVLSENGILSKCVTYNETSHGIFIGVRMDDNTPINYIYTNNTISHFSNLDGYTIFAYSLKHDALLVGFYDKTVRLADTMSRDFSIYKLKPNEIVKQIRYNVDVWHPQLSSDQDSLVFYPNLKNSGGVGSTPTRTAVKIKYQ